MWINLTEAQLQWLIKVGGIYQRTERYKPSKQERGVSERAMAKLERARHDSYREKEGE
jgi:hypothetical protein